MLLVPPGGGNRNRKASGNNFGPTISVEPISASKEIPITNSNRKESGNNFHPNLVVEPLSATSKEGQDQHPQVNRIWKASGINFPHNLVVEPLSATSKEHPDSDNVNNDTLPLATASKEVVRQGSKNMITTSRSSKNLGGFDDYYGMLSKKKVPRFGQTQIGHHEEPFDPKKEN